MIFVLCPVSFSTTSFCELRIKGNRIIYLVFIDPTLSIYVNLHDKPTQEQDLPLFIDEESEAWRVRDKPVNGTKEM